MKCAYGNNCKNGGNVEKEKAVKISNKYYCPECLKEKELKQEIEKYYREKFNSKEPLMNVRGAISKYIKDGYQADYIMFCLQAKAKNLNSLYGLVYQLSNNNNLTEFTSLKNKKIDIKFEEYGDVDYQNNIKIQPKKEKNWGDIFG